jgi:hypothetical protein
MQRLLLLFSFLLFSTFLFAHRSECSATVAGKDTLLLMNGDKLGGDVIDTAYHKTKLKYLRRNGKEKTVLFENDQIFSIQYRNGRENILYEQDTVSGNYFSAEETRMFIYGERDAERHYHCPASTAGGILVGFASGYVGSFLSLVPPFAFSGLLLIPKIKIKYKTVSVPEYLNFDTYVLGYEKVAKRKRLFRSLVGGIGGLGLGLVTFQQWFPNA